MNYLRSFDILGKELGFVENGFSSFKTSQGIFLSLLGFTVSIIISSMFGQEVWERKQPIVSVAQEALLTSEIRFREFPFLIGVYTKAGGPIPDYRSIINLDLVKIVISEKEVTLNVSKNFTECRTELFTSHVDLVKEKLETSTNKFLCIDSLTEDPYFSNSFGYINSVSYMIEISKCNPQFQNCHPNLDEILKDFYVSSIMFNSYSDPSNYDIPITFLPENIPQQCTTSLHKRNYIRITRDLFESDNGWLLADKAQKDYISLESIKIDLSQPTKSLYDDSMLIYTIIFEAPKKRLMTTRSYMKVQDLFAKIGGLMNVIFIIFKAVSSHFISFKYKNFVLNHTVFQESKFPSDKNVIDKQRNLPDESQLRVGNSNTINNIDCTTKKAGAVDLKDAGGSSIILNNYLSNFNSVNSMEMRSIAISYFSHFIAVILCQSKKLSKYKVLTEIADRHTSFRQYLKMIHSFQRELMGNMARAL